MTFNYISKLAASKAQEDNREFFKNFFQQDFSSNQGKVFGIADAYYFKFRNSPNFEEERESKLSGLTSIDQVSSNILQTTKRELSPKEKKLEEICKKYDINIVDPLSTSNSSKITAEVIKKISDSGLDPKYFDWIVKILDSNIVEPIEQVISSVKIYSKNLDKLDQPIDSFSKLSELRDYLDLKLVGNRDLILQKAEPIAKDNKYTDFIYESDNFVVILPGTTASSQWWAQGTTWCTGYLSGNFFANYSLDKNYLYYIITKQTSQFFSKSNPKRKMCIGLWKEGKGKSTSLRIEEGVNGGKTVDLENHGLYESEIKSYLGSEGSEIISKIRQNAMSRTTNKFIEICESATTVEDVERLAEYNSFNSFSDTKDTIFINIIKRTNDPAVKEAAVKARARLFPEEFLEKDSSKYPQYEKIAIDAVYKEYIQSKNGSENNERYELPYIFYKKIIKYPEILNEIIDDLDPHSFLKYIGKKRKDKVEEYIQKCVESDPIGFLEFEDYTENYPEYEKKAVYNAAENSPHKYLEGYNSLYKRYYPDAEKIAILNIVEQSPGIYLSKFITKYPGYENKAVKNIAEKYPIVYIKEYSKIYPQYFSQAAEIFANQDPIGFYSFAQENLRSSVSAEYMKIAAEKISLTKPEFFMSKLSFRFPEFTENAIKLLAENNPEEYFEYYMDKKKDPVISSFKDIAVENLINKSPKVFLDKMLYLEFPQLKEIAESRVSTSDADKKIATLVSALNTLGLKKEASNIRNFLKLI